MPGLGEEIYDRILCFRVGAWLEALFARAGQPMPDASIATFGDRSFSPVPGLSLKIERTSEPLLNPGDRLAIYRAEFDRSAPMPRGLDPVAETPASARAKLTTGTDGGTPEDYAKGDFRTSYFMPGGRVIGIHFHPTLVGFDRIILVRLGTPVDFASDGPTR